MKRNVVHYSSHYTAIVLFECKSFVITQVELHYESLITTGRNIWKFITQQPRASVSEWLLQFDKKKSDMAPVYVFKVWNPQKYFKTQFISLRKHTACKSQKKVSKRVNHKKISKQCVSNNHW